MVGIYIVIALLIIVGTGALYRRFTSHDGMFGPTAVR